MNKHVGFIHTLDATDALGRVVDTSGPTCNRVPAAGLDFLIRAPFGDAVAINTIYAGLFLANFLPQDNTSAADLPILMNEFTQFTEPTRPIWERVYNGSGSYDNDDSPAVFTPTQDVMVYGSFLISAGDKGGNTGLMLSVTRFPSAVRLTAGNPGRLRTSLTYLPTDVI